MPQRRAQWDADVEVGEELVRELLEEQFPELDVSSVRLLGEGWDNAVWLVQEQWAFRFPRRAIAAPLVERELAVLLPLSTLVSAPLPAPVYSGRPSERYPWSFFGSPLLPGRELCEAVLSEDEEVALGDELGRFLRVLHAPGTRAAVDPEGALPIDHNRRADMPFRVERTRAELQALEAGDLWEPRAEADAILESARLLPPSEQRSLTHGDLHLRHVLVEGGALSGVIDWGDVCLADPAIDLVLYWSSLGERGRAALVAAYGAVGDDQLLRARVLSLFLCAILAQYAHDVGRVSLERAALAGLDRTLVD